jgi:hypothetical protein
VRQRELAGAIRTAAAELHGDRRRAVLDRTLLIEVADSTDEVLELLGEIVKLGVEVERRP